MYSEDIYIKVGKKLEDSGLAQLGINYYTQREKKEIVEKLQQALLEYTDEKLIDCDFEQVTVMDLGVLFDRIDLYLLEPEKERFYQHYVHTMLNVYNNLEDTNYLWSEEEAVSEEEYPKFEKEGTYLEFFKTSTNSSNKENALWLLNYLKESYDRKIYTKK